MPQLGESVTEGTISKWLVEPGDHVQKYDPLAEVLTDKVSAEIPSSYTGTIKELIAKEDETLAVGEVICTIETEGDQAESKAEQKTAPSAVQQDGDLNEPKKEQKTDTDKGKIRYSPAVLRMSQEYQIDLSQVKGSGRDGRITRKDLQRLIDSGNIPKAGEAKKEAEAQMPAAKPAAPAAAVPHSPGDVEIPVAGIRKAIAANMVRSKQEIPHAWMMIEADVTNLVNYRNSIKEEFQRREGFNITYFAFFVKAVAQALKEFPMINSMWAGDKIVQKKEINISIAVASEDSLFVPVIKHADEQSVKGIAKAIHELAIKARTGKLKKEDVEGGTFTVNNTGAFGSIQSMGIINHPQAAILQIESIVKRPIVTNDHAIAVRDMVNMCLSLDHRILDGLVCGRFLKRVKAILENMSKENTSVY
jgi:2-oxoisovalerate dehydrogenase E2 component (dihydrolipoyl transacylase)